MQRIQIQLPEAFSFAAPLHTRITDLNFGNHVGNDAFAGLLHEARVQFLAQYGCTELQAGGTALIMADLAIEYKKELMYPDALQVWVAACGMAGHGFDVVYKMEVYREDRWQVAALAKTGMLCYDYAAKKLMRVPPALVQLLGLG